MGDMDAGPNQDAARRVATVDVGTNSTRLLVAETHPDGSYQLLDDEKVVTRLGRGVAKSGRLDPEAMRETAEAIRNLRAIANGHGAERIRAVATCAVREATNGHDFVAMVKADAGIDLEVIDGEEEAHLAYLSVRNAFDVRRGVVAIVDIGGGSTELVLTAGGIVQQVVSFALGAVRLTEAVADEPAMRRLKTLRGIIRDEYKSRVPFHDVAPRLLIGTGGTFTTLAQMDLHRRHGDKVPDVASIRGYEVHLAEVRRHMERLNVLPPERRLSVPGLSPDRAEIIVAGLAIIAFFMKKMAIPRLRVHDRGIRDGVLISMTRELFPDAPEPAPEAPDRMTAVRRFAERCRYPQEHCEHVATLALRIYDQLEPIVDPAKTTMYDHDGARELLRTAAILHDIGYYINYQRHHIHSYHLIIHSQMPGFSHHELELIANVARYHRRAHPKMKHASYRGMNHEDRALIRELSAVLRIADGLDRTHARSVRDVRVEAEPGAVIFTAFADFNPEVDLWGAARKSQLFDKVFRLEPNFFWAGAKAVAVKSATES